MTNRPGGTPYLGVTSNLDRRAWEHPPGEPELGPPYDRCAWRRGWPGQARPWRCARDRTL